jgi:hypothetical protein
MQYTVSYDDNINGWSSFYSYLPEWMVNMNNEFYTFKDGQIYIHNQVSAPRNNFYGVQYNTEVEVVSNEGPSEVKIFKTIGLESSTGNWNVEIDTNLDAGHVSSSSFERKEDMYYAYIRRDSTLNTQLTSVKGIGVPTSVSSGSYTFSSIPSGVNIGDTLYSKNTSDPQNEVGVITGITGTTILVASEIDPPTTGAFMYVGKSSIAESTGLKGYYANVRLVNDDTTDVELYAVNTGISKSFP